MRVGLALLLVLLAPGALAQEDAQVVIHVVVRGGQATDDAPLLEPEDHVLLLVRNDDLVDRQLTIETPPSGCIGPLQVVNALLPAGQEVSTDLVVDPRFGERVPYEIDGQVAGAFFVDAPGSVTSQGCARVFPVPGPGALVVLGVVAAAIARRLGRP